MIHNLNKYKQISLVDKQCLDLSRVTEHCYHKILDAKNTIYPVAVKAGLTKNEFKDMFSALVKGKIVNLRIDKDS